VLSRLDGDVARKMMQDHALPEGWHKMVYDDFLTARRSLMAAVIKKGFEALS